MKNKLMKENQNSIINKKKNKRYIQVWKKI